MPKLLDIKTIEGTWEEALAHSELMAGHLVRIEIDPPLSLKVGIAPPKIGRGTFEEIMANVRSQGVHEENEDDLMEAIAQNREMRRSFSEGNSH